PFFLVPHLEINDIVYRGKKGMGIEFSLAIAQSGGVQIELVQQHCDRPSAYRDTIAKGEQGFHHICFYLDNYDATYDRYVKQGFVAAVDGLFGNTRFSYIDTSASIGCMVELIEHNEVQTNFFQRIIDGANGWDGKTDPIRPGFPA
ncbi:MAG: VOC family protein, partial [Rhodospirillaceae bacterium]